jgi:hypothetical protein
MDVTFGDKNQFEEGTVFGRGVKLGDNNKVWAVCVGRLLFWAHTQT